MGLHTKLEDDVAGELADEAADVVPDRPGERAQLGWVTKVPLLPLIAGIGAVSVVTAAWSTSQISLNFAGGTPAQPLIEAQNGAVAPRGPSEERAGPSNGATIAFRATGRSETGFRGVVTITNRGTRPIDDWTLVFRIPNARVLSASNVVLVKAGSVATVRNRSAAPEIEPGSSVRLVFTARGPSSTPSACSFNGVVCTLD